MRTEAISARLRPIRSAMTPNVIPPAAADRSVTDPSAPAALVDRRSDGSSINAASTIAYSMTSNESSIQPREAAMNARRARRSASIHQPNNVLSRAEGRAISMILAIWNQVFGMWNAYEAPASQARIPDSEFQIPNCDVLNLLQWPSPEYLPAADQL